MNNESAQLELLVLNKQEALLAKRLGVDRIEIIKNLDRGGLTPDFPVIKAITTAIDIPAYIKLRNKWDTYVYDDYEFALCLQQLEMIKLTKAKGIVFGSLNKDGTINEDQLQKIIKNKGPLELVFGKAIDSVVDYLEAITILEGYDEVKNILTSGHAEKAMDGMFNLSHAARISGNKLIIGSGITPENCREFLAIEGINKLHVGTFVRENLTITDEINRDKVKLILEYLQT